LQVGIVFVHFKIFVLKRFLFIGLCCLPFLMHAQNHHEIGVWVGAANYHGDLQHNWIPTGPKGGKTYQPSVGAIYKYFPNPQYGFRFGASYIRITAADSLSDVKADQLRNLSFSNNIVELYGAFELNFLPIEVNKFKVTPYVFAGIGAFYGRPFAENPEGKKMNLRSLSTEGQGLPQYPDRKVYPLVNAMFPIGGGMKFFIGNTVMLTAEVGLRYTATDYLDDVSRTYVNMDTLLAYKGQNSVDMSYRGNEKNKWDGNYPNYTFHRGDFKQNDWYWTAGVTATIYFDAFGNIKKYLQTQCPRIFGIR
jgi:hypothetical protein